MTDINFDELDKAVNSVLEGSEVKPGGDKPASETVDKPAERAETKESTAIAVNKPEKSEPEPSKASESPPVSKPAKSPSPSSPIDRGRRSGMFMDVVHPSVTKKPELVHKGSKTVKPLNADVKPEGPEQESKEEPKPVTDPVAEPELPESPKPEPAEEPIAKPAEVPANEPKAGSSDTEAAAQPAAPDQAWPDPLDVHGFKYDEKDTGKDEEKDDAKVTQESEPAADKAEEQSESEPPATDQTEPKPDEPTPSEPPTTPFLTGTKVEKRPLGAFAEQDQVPEDKSPVTDKPAEDTTEPGDNQNPPVVPEKLPPELSDEVLAVEGGEFNAGETAKPDEDKKPDTQESKPDPQEAKPEGKQPEESNVVTAAGSIPPQYHEQAGEEQSPTHHMLVTQDHQTPLLEPSHHSKHAVLWITLAVIILLATGAGFAWWFLIATA